jgi:Transposase
MAKSKHGKRYPPEFHRQLVELARAGRSIVELSREFGCSYWTIRNWVKQADRDEGRGDGGLTTGEHEELVSWFGCGVRTNACGWSAKSWEKRRPGSHRRRRPIPGALRIREREPGSLSA